MDRAVAIDVERRSPAPRITASPLDVVTGLRAALDPSDNDVDRVADAGLRLLEADAGADSDADPGRVVAELARDLELSPQDMGFVVSAVGGEDDA